MKMLIILTMFLSILSAGIFAQTSSPINLANNLQNDKEATSLYIDKKEEKQIKHFEQNLSYSESKALFLKTLSSFNSSNICAYKLVNQLASITSSFGHPKFFFYSLRKHDDLDDVSLNTLLVNLKMQQETISISSQEINPFIQFSPEIKNAFKDFSKSLKNRCVDEVYKILIAKLKMNHIKNTEDYIEQAYLQNVIDYQTFQMIIRAYKVKLEQTTLPLRDYLAKKESIRNERPNTSGDRCDFVTHKVPKTDIGNRTRLYQRYNMIQVLALAEIIKNLKQHLDSPRITMDAYDNNGNIIRHIELEEMERFRFAIRFLRKEMKLLSTNNYFEGSSPTYSDIMTAAFETGLVSAVEINTLVSLEEFWNPHKTFYEKASTWIRMGATVGSLVLTGPYSFLPALALVVIEATAKKSEKLETPEHSLF